MNIMVFGVPTDSGGGLNILLELYNEVIEFDKENQWYFVVSTTNLKEYEKINVLNYPWAKKSWIHRIVFDYFIAGAITKKYNIDKILSLHNINIKRTKVPQVLYLHQALPFTEIKYSFKENRSLWVRQNIIGRMILNSLKKTDKVIVQTKWMAEACLNKVKLDRQKISIIPPSIDLIPKSFFHLNEKSTKKFFYPAGGSEYKNHRIIIEACTRLLEKGITNYEVFLTLDGNENDSIANLKKVSKKLNLPINFIGNIPREEVFEYYCNSILLFPSYIETFGLPLLEAKLHRTIIISANTPFALEILTDYRTVYYHDAFDSEGLADLMRNCINKNFNWEINNANKKLLNRRKIIDELIN